jgi:hypothetical protein
MRLVELFAPHNEAADTKSQPIDFRPLLQSEREQIARLKARVISLTGIPADCSEKDWHGRLGGLLRGLGHNPGFWNFTLAEAAEAIGAPTRKKAGKQKPAPPLSDQEKKVLDVIPISPGAITGKQIETATGILQSVITSHIIPTLKEHFGVKNRRSVGYYR